MRRAVAASVLAMCAAGAIAWGSERPASAAQAPECSEATALQVAAPQFVWGPGLKDPIVQVLCGPFTGPGSVAMAVTFSAPTCWAPQGWAVYRFVDGAWQMVFHQPLQFLLGDLVAVDGGIRETQPVHRQGDARCLPSGGTRARNWSWDGTRLVAGAWEQVTPGRRSAIMFARPPARGTCELIDDGTDEGSLVHCWLRHRGGPHVEMNVHGEVDRASDQPLPTGLGGPRSPAQVTVGRFRCRSQRNGVRCFVVETGKSFLFAPQRPRRREGVARFPHFKTPSANIVCTTPPRGRLYVACSIKSGLKPPPPRVECDTGSFDDRGISLGETGRPTWGGCAGDPGPLVAEDHARVLGYGRRWRRGDVRCSSTRNGLTCTNRSGHGFFLSKARSRRF